MPKKIKTALISVYDKTHIVEFANFLSKKGITIISTGGTADILRQGGYDVVDVSKHTGFPEIMDGRVKTLHPKIHGGILGKRDDETHLQALNDNNITTIDLVIVNLYPFEETVASGADINSCIENIDVGGPSMIRAAAKNFKDVVIVTDPNDYVDIQEYIEKDGDIPLTLRQSLAHKAFSLSAQYDNAIAQWFSGLNEDKEIFPKTFSHKATRHLQLRYGENPHQQAALYTDNSNILGIATAKQIQGKELSFNNIVDADAAYELVNEFDQPSVAIIKHANPCGVASDNNLISAYEKALACDPVSAYGSIIAFNKPIDKTTSEKIESMFVEVVIAPDADENALEQLKTKKNLRILLTGGLPERTRKELLLKSITGGLLVQERDYGSITNDQLNIVSKRKPKKDEIEEMLFAFTISKHVKSNAIVTTKNHATLGIGAGQMSRVDSVRIATEKANALEEGKEGLTLASDAFFPFSDGVELAAKAGVSCIIHPGGSKRDDEVIAAADENNIAMIFTGQRHFRH